MKHSIAMVDSRSIEHLILATSICGAGFLAIYVTFGKSAKQIGGRLEQVFVELQRKAFHMIGGCIICATYHWGIKSGLMVPAFAAHEFNTNVGAVDAGAAFLSVCFASWLLEASRLLIPAVQQWYLSSFQSLVRQKEHNKAAGIATFFQGR
eukprot:TRINITY_DN33851_c0_g1_i2.p2 TRINITY_DN33851_c0_g1~~TRINITY_DN33851_c0_g1_i2.p2  ORF type:complete len:151 (+),score=32.55 TRINITY_DN33851_c0_g1_i2:35-487(+)